jgi:Ca2+-binding EF-hand superfamily protein
MRRVSWTLAAAALAALAAPAFAHDGGRFGEDFTAARDAAFKQADANGDGKLTQDEFVAFEEGLRQNLTAARFKRLDTDGDGTVSAAELAAAPRLHRRGRK